MREGLRSLKVTMAKQVPYGHDCIIGGRFVGNAYAYEGCVGDGIIMRHNGEERPLRPRIRRGLAP
jgi:hypothetical protein